MKTFLLTFAFCIVLAFIFMPTIGNHIRDKEQAEWCAAFEKRDEFSQAEAERYLDYCPHFDMATQREVPGRKLVK